MGPDIWELFEDGQGEDETAAIIKLGDIFALPQGVRVVTQFGQIVTVRLKRAALPSVSGSPEVASMIAGDSYQGPDLEEGDMEGETLSSDQILPTDERRPPHVTETGRGIVVGVVDWGFDFAHPDFRNPDGTTRILALWDQRGGQTPGSPQPFGYGVVHDRDAINRALKTPDPYAALRYHPADADTYIGSRCIGSHGTHVASIAAGSGGNARPAGIAPEADLVFVHNAPWNNAESGRLGDSVSLLEGIDFISRIAEDRAWVVNLSMGRHGEQHDGSTLIEQGLDTVISMAPGRAVCMSAGNYFDKRVHSSGRLRPTQERTFVWEINERSPTFNELEIWYSWQDKFEVEVRSPDGFITGRARIGERAKFIVGGQEIGNIYHRSGESNSLDNQIYVYLYKEAAPGAWEVSLRGLDIIDGRFHAWIERDVSCPECQSHFRDADADPHSTTGTICNGRRTIAVGAYNNHDPETPVARFSSVGPTRDGRLKPDLCAPGVSVLAARSRPRAESGKIPLLTRMSGTSMAAPHVAGTVALMFQAARRLLRIEETHNLLLESADRVSIQEQIQDRIGIGFLDVSAAVEAVRKIKTVPSFKKATVEAPAFQSLKPRDGEEASVRESAPAAVPEAARVGIKTASAVDREISIENADRNLSESAGVLAKSGEGTEAETDSGRSEALPCGCGQGRVSAIADGAGRNLQGFQKLSQARPLSLNSTLNQESTMSVRLSENRPVAECGGTENDGAALVELADRFVAGRLAAGTPILQQLLEWTGTGEALAVPGGRLATPTEIFDAFASPQRTAMKRQLEQFFEVIVLPQQPLEREILEGDVLLRRGEDVIGYISVIASGELLDRASSAARGRILESLSEGMFVQVVETGPRPHTLEDTFGRRITNSAGAVLRDTMVLRLRKSASEAVWKGLADSSANRLLRDIVILRLATQPTVLPPTVVNVTAPAPTTTLSDTDAEEATCPHYLDPSGLSWPGATPEQAAFMRQVYLTQVMNACSRRTFVADIRDSDLGSIEARRERALHAAADRCRALLAAARAAILSDPAATGITISILSGYRSASEQFRLWNRNFHIYFQQTQSTRAGFGSGELGAEAVRFLAQYIGQRLAAPGFSLHNNGLAVDFGTVQNGLSMRADTNSRSVRNWRNSWFYQWLTANAGQFGYYQNTSINEPWHWEFRAAAAPTQSFEADDGALRPERSDTGESLGVGSPFLMQALTHYHERRNTITDEIKKTDDKVNLNIPKEAVRSAQDRADDPLFVPHIEDLKLGFESFPTDKDEYSALLESICGVTDDSQPVEQYDGSLGVTAAFVATHQSAACQVQWNNNLASIYSNPGNVSGVRWGSGTMISNDLFLTCAHLFDQTGGRWNRPRVNGTTNIIPPQEIARNMHLNFNYQVDPAGNLRAQQSFPILELIEYRLGGLDMALCRIGGNPGAIFGRATLSATDAAPPDMLCIIGHPAGKPKRIEAGKTTLIRGNRIEYNDIDTLGGNSGSGILRARDGRLVGIHTNGGCTAASPAGGSSNFGQRIAAVIAASPTLQALLRPRQTTFRQ